MQSNFQTKYRVLSKIGEGTFSEVLRCQNRQSGQLVAAKRLRKSFQSMAEANEIPEFRAMKNLPQHPNILHLIETHYEPAITRVTLVFELMDMSIYDMMKTHTRCIPEVKVKNYLYQILKGIHHLHSQGIFHRDIKPENILIKGQVIKIADLGSVRGIFSLRPFTEYISTRWYRSPECLLTCGYYSSKMDIWSAGCVFFELLTLRPLFPGSNELDQISRIHIILGTPKQALLSRFKKHKSQNVEIIFPPKSGTGLSCLLPNISDSGKDIMKLMLIYDPKIRASATKLLDHRYFNDLRDAENMRGKISHPTMHSGRSNPVLLSYLTTEKRRRPKPARGLVPKPQKKEMTKSDVEKLQKSKQIIDSKLPSIEISSTKKEVLKNEPKPEIEKVEKSKSGKSKSITIQVSRGKILQKSHHPDPKRHDPKLSFLPPIVERNAKKTENKVQNISRKTH